MAQSGIEPTTPQIHRANALPLTTHDDLKISKGHIDHDPTPKFLRPILTMTQPQNLLEPSFQILNPTFPGR